MSVALLLTKLQPELIPNFHRFSFRIGVPGDKGCVESGAGESEQQTGQYEGVRDTEGGTYGQVRQD